METARQCLDEVVINKPFDIEEAVSSLRFYANLAKQKGETIKMELWARRNAVIPSKEVVKSMA